MYPQAGQKLLQHQGKAPMFLFGYLDLAYLVHNSRQNLDFPTICITFCTTYVRSAIQLYRENFEPSEYLDKPYVSMGVPVVADTDEEAQFLATSAYQRVLGLIRGESLKLKPPVESMQGLWNTAEQLSSKTSMQWRKLVL